MTKKTILILIMTLVTLIALIGCSSISTANNLVEAHLSNNGEKELNTIEMCFKDVKEYIIVNDNAKTAVEISTSDTCISAEYTEQDSKVILRAEKVGVANLKVLVKNKKGVTISTDYNITVSPIEQNLSATIIEGENTTLNDTLITVTKGTSFNVDLQTEDNSNIIVTTDIAKENLSYVVDNNTITFTANQVFAGNINIVSTNQNFIDKTLTYSVTANPTNEEIEAEKQRLQQEQEQKKVEEQKRLEEKKKAEANKSRSSSAVSNSVVSQEPVFVLNPKKPYYYRNLLSEDEKLMYDEIYEGVINLQTGINITPINTNMARVGLIMMGIVCDNPELFWLETGAYTIRRPTMDSGYDYIEPQYNELINDYENNKRRFDEQINIALAGMKTKKSEDEVIKYIHNYISDNVKFILDSPLNQSVYSAAVYKSSVCVGYAKLTGHLLNQAGIPSTIVYGDTINGSHAWNVVKTRNGCLNLDINWDDWNGNAKGKYNYKYYLVSDNVLAQSKAKHVRNSFGLMMPACP